MNLLELAAVERSYHSGQQTWKIGPVSFMVAAEEEIAIMGPSGSGKSTLLHLIGALDMNSSGKILFQEKDISKYSAPERENYRNREIGFVFQGFFLMPEFTLWENVAMPLCIAGEKRTVRREKAEAALAAVHLDQRTQHFPHELSGGERQRAAIARALIHQPKLLLADEPTGNLDAHNGALIMDLLQEVRRQHKITLLMVTHDESLATRLARRILLRDGQLISDERK